MKQIIRFALLMVTIVALPACNLGRSSEPQALATLSLPSVSLTIHGSGPATPFAAGQTINFQYTVSNVGNSALAGPVTVASDKGPVACPDVRTAGNQNGNLDPLESLNCTGSYILAQADVTAGSVTNTATAAVGGASSALASVTVRSPENKVLTISRTANPITYSQAGQIVTFTYVITNGGTASLGPAQFIVNDDHIATPVNCGPPDTTLAATQTVTCTAAYTITQADVSAGSVTSSATSTGAGATSVQPASTTLNLAGGSIPQSPSGNYTRGSTIQYKVVEGEWLIQISRCFGADPKAVSSANPQLDDPAEISPGDVLTIPNLGSNGTIYGPPCITFHTVQSGDTWNSIALKYNADLDVLRAANPNVSLTSGAKVRIPLNSAGGTASTGATQIPPTQNPTACNQAQMASDVTVPDGTSMAAGTTFTKTWRLKNTGTCTWTSTYLLIFDHGEVMGAPGSAPLTTVNVPPGSTTDVSVILKAPATPGTYQADFRLRSPDGIVFGIGSSGQASFWVKIVVPGATPGATPSTGSSDVVALLGKKAVGGVEITAFQTVYTNGPCLETAAGSGVLECASKTGETPFIRLVVSNPADLANSTIKDIRIFPKYTGNLPEGLTWTMTRQAIELKLGAPLTEPIDNGNGTIDVEYKTTNPAYRLWATFGANDPSNAAIMRRMRIAVP